MGGKNRTQTPICFFLVQDSFKGDLLQKKIWVDCPFKSLERKSAGHAGEECVNLFIAIDMIPITDQLTAMNIMPFKLCTKIQKYLTIRNSA